MAGPRVDCSRPRFAYSDDIELSTVMAELDLTSYFARIGFAGPSETTLGTLQALHRLHPAAITFENLDPLMGRRVSLEIGAVVGKLVDQRRGGYCYEQNMLFASVLRSLGYSVAALPARVKWGVAEGVVRPRTHMVLRVRLPEGDYLVDVGFGRLTLTAPVRWQPDIEQRTPHGLLRLIRVGDELQLQVRLVDLWAPIYQVSLEEQIPADWEVANWFSSTHPDSIFTHSLIVARPVGDRIYALLNHRLSIHHADGTVERQIAEGPSELASLLQNQFGVSLPEGCEGIIARLAKG